MELECWISGMAMPVEVASISRIAVRNWQAAGCPDNIDGFLDAHGYTVREVRAIARFALDACHGVVVKPEPLPA